MDYFKILNLNREPFSNSPDPELFYHSQQHQGCLQKIELAIRMRRGLNVVLGEVGTGKTTLCRQLIRGFAGDEGVESYLILDPDVTTATEFLSTVAAMFEPGRSFSGFSEWQLKESIKNYLYRQGVDDDKVVLLIIDEGQKTPDFCLELLREFLNYETNEAKLLQIVIFAQQEFSERIALLPNFADRINLCHTIEPLNLKDTSAMIRHRLELASADGQGAAIFSLPALWLVYRVTGGYPRKIINLCHQIILTTIIQNRTKVTWAIVRSCARRTFAREKAEWRLARIGALTAGLVVILFVAYSPENVFRRLGLFSTSPATQLNVSPPAAVRVQLVAKEQPALVAELPASKPVPEPAQSIGASAIATVESPELPPAVDANDTPPEILGTVRVDVNDTLSGMIRAIYGPRSFTPANLKTVLAANPQIANPDFISAGSFIRFPVIVFEDANGLKQPWWIVLATTYELEPAYRLARELIFSGMSPPYILPVWSRDEGLRFMLIHERTFLEDGPAQKFLAQMPTNIVQASLRKADLDSSFIFRQ